MSNSGKGAGVGQKKSERTTDSGKVPIEKVTTTTTTLKRSVATMSATTSKLALEEFVMEEDVLVLIDSTGKKRAPDPKVLQKALEAVKSYLKKDASKVDSLVKYKGFVQFFVRCLQTASGNLTSLQFNSAWVFEKILTHGSKTVVATIVDSETVAIPLLLKFLQSPDRTIYEKTVSVIRALVEIDVCRTQLDYEAASLFMPLTKHLKGKKPSKQLITDSAAIVKELLVNRSEFRKVFEEEKRNVKAAMFNESEINEVEAKACKVDKCLPPARLAKQALPVIGALLDLDDSMTDITGQMLEGLIVCANVLQDIKPMVESGCCPKVVACFTSDSEHTLLSAANVLGSIAVCGPRQLFAFLKTLKGTGGLGNYWKCFKLVEDSEIAEETPLTRAIGNFVGVVADVVHHNINNEGIDAAISSGMIDSFVHCVQDETIPRRYQHDALCILQCMLCQLRPERREVATNILPHVLEHLKGHYYCGLADKCILIVQKLTEDNCERRDKAIAIGGVSVLLEFLEHVETEKAQVALNCILFLLQGKPRVDLEHFSMIPTAMKEFIESAYMENVIFESTEVETILCIIQEISAYGTDGIELIIESGWHFKMQSMLALDKCPQIVRLCMDCLQNICLMGTKVHRKELLRIGILTDLQSVLCLPQDAIRKSALVCLDMFITNLKLTAEDRDDAKKLGPLVKAELSKNVLGTQCLAKSIYERIARMK